MKGATTIPISSRYPERKAYNVMFLISSTIFCFFQLQQYYDYFYSGKS